MFYIGGCASNNIDFARDSPGSVTVRSTGIGETLDLAKENALRNAVQNATGALIVTERRIENEKLSQSDISYSKGIVESFKLIDAYRNPSDKLYNVNAEVMVSTAKFYSRILTSQSNADLNGTQISSGLANAKAQVRSQQIRLERSQELLKFVLNNMSNAIDSNIGTVEVKKDGRNVDALVEVTTWINIPSLISLCKAVNLYSDDFFALESSASEVHSNVGGSINSVISGLLNPNSVTNAKNRAYPNNSNLIVNAPMTGCFIAGNSGYYKVPDNYLNQLFIERKNLGICLTFVNSENFSIYRKFFSNKSINNNIPIYFASEGSVEFEAKNSVFSGYPTSSFHTNLLSISDVPDSIVNSTKSFQSKVTKINSCR